MACSWEAHTRYFALSWAEGGLGGHAKDAEMKPLPESPKQRPRAQPPFGVGLCRSVSWTRVVSLITLPEMGQPWGVWRGFLEFDEGPYLGKIGSEA